MLFARTQAECPSLAPGTIPDTFGVNHLCVSETKQEAMLRKHSRSWGRIVLLLLFLISKAKIILTFSHSTCSAREAASFFGQGYLPEPPQRHTVTQVSGSGHGHRPPDLTKSSHFKCE